MTDATEAPATAPAAAPDAPAAAPEGAVSAELTPDAGSASDAKPEPKSETKAETKAETKPEEKKPKAKDFVEMRRKEKELRARTEALEARSKALAEQDARLAEARKAFAEDPWAFFERISEESGTPFHEVVEAINRRVLAGGKRTEKDDQLAGARKMGDLERKIAELEAREKAALEKESRARSEAAASAAVDAAKDRFPLVSAFPRDRVVAAVLQTIADSGKPLAHEDALGMLEEELAQLQAAFPSREGAAKAAKPETVAATRGQTPASSTLTNRDAAQSVGAPDDDEDVPRWQWARRAARRAMSG